LFSLFLGIGGFGHVFLVQANNKDSFALKRLKKIDMVQQNQQEHAYSEKQVMLACNSPFIVRLVFFTVMADDSFELLSC
jgi:cGMP-dependent protein kinase